jgi:hypothetical protein
MTGLCYLLRTWWVGNSCLLVALIAALTLQSQSSMAAQAGYEALPVLSASRILPPELLTGTNFRVQERVNSDGIVNIYAIDSRFGTFTAISTAMLRIRIQEINAMAVMDRLKGTKEYADSLKAFGLSALVAAKDMVFQPIKTGTEVVSGVGLLANAP